MLFVRPEQQPAVRERLKHLIHVPFKFDDGGTRIVMYNPTGLN